MAEPTPVAEHAHTNGDGARAELNGSGLRDRLAPLGAMSRAGGPLGRVGRGLFAAAETVASEAASSAARRARQRLRADLDDRDPDWLRERLPLLWLLATIWFRGEVRNLGNIPEKGPVLLVGNHSGGNVTPDTFIFTLAFSSYFGIERKFHQLAHNLVVTLPVSGGLVRRGGTVAASHKNAEKALKAGAALLVYPGGDWEVHRPSWETAKVDFAGRKGFIRLALDQDVPIVPVVSIGGQETALFLSRGDRLAKALRLDKMFRLKVLPISLVVPWGLNVGDFLGHLPLPAKITTEVLPAIHLREQFGPEPDPAEVYEHITRQMQEALDALASERRYPFIG
ncbi:MAG: lysophospholipid acyltransferase family protein [Solirubrobacterales bacterium]